MYVVGREERIGICRRGWRGGCGSFVVFLFLSTWEQVVTMTRGGGGAFDMRLSVLGAKFVFLCHPHGWKRQPLFTLRFPLYHY